MTETHKAAVEALEPCPFCGDKAKYDYYPGEGDNTVRCLNIHSCGAKLQGFSGHKSHVINAWNTRTLKQPSSVDVTVTEFISMVEICFMSDNRAETRAAIYDAIKANNLRITRAAATDGVKS